MAKTALPTLFALLAAFGLSLASSEQELREEFLQLKKSSDAKPYDLGRDVFLQHILEMSKRAAERKEFSQVEENLRKARQLVRNNLAFRERAESSGIEMKWLRRGKVHFQGITGDTVTITAVPVQNWEQYFYITGPGNRTVYKTLVKTDRISSQDFTGMVDGEQYTLHLKPSYVARISFRKAKKVVFEPEREFTSLFQNKASGIPLYLKVPQGTGELRLVGTNMHGFHGSAAEIRVRPPDGPGEFRMDLAEKNVKSLVRELRIDAGKYKSDWGSDESDVPNYRILTQDIRIQSPRPGMWSVNAYSTTFQSDDLGIWVEGAPNYLAPSPEAWFQPEFRTGRAGIVVNGRTTLGKRPEVGAVWGWQSHQDKARAAYADLGLAGDLIFLSQRHVEPENDNGDPSTLDLDGFRFDPSVKSRFAASLATPGITSTIVPLINPSDWLVRQEKAGGDAPLQEIAEFFEAAVRYSAPYLKSTPRKYYWQFHNEANHFMSKSRFLEYMGEIGKRKISMGAAFPGNFLLGGPALGNAIDEKEVVNWDWVKSLIKEGDGYLDAVIWNQYHIQELNDTWQFRTLIDSTRRLIEEYDSDGVLEPIVLGQVNMREGIYLQSELQDGFYNALWWISSLVNIFATGKVALVDYFMLADADSRKKGMFNEKGEPKPVAKATKLFLGSVQNEVVEAKSDHDGLDVLATRSEDGKRWTVVYVNRTPGPMEISQDWNAGLPSNGRMRSMSAKSPIAREMKFEMKGGKVQATLDPYSITLLQFAP